MIPEGSCVRCDEPFKAHPSRRLRGAAGMCRGCTRHAHRCGLLRWYLTARRSPGRVQPCERCGQESRGGLCDDCRWVLADLGELERWTA